ncbi:M15 family metallopeptidase [Nakamurella sp. GG22]
MSTFSRRRALQLGTLTAGAVALGVGGVSHAAPSGDAGADGAPAEDPRFAGKFAQSLEANALSATSYNGWPVGSPASAIGVGSYPVPGTSIRLQLKGGDVATVLTYVAGRFNAEVEKLISYQSGGYSYRMNVNNPSVWSNHASGTAMDLNWELHPNGAPVSRGFTSGEVAAIRRILADCNGVVYWGGDYRGTVDAMHFEIDVRPPDVKLSALAARIRGVKTGSTLRSRANNRLVCAETHGTLPLIANRTAVGPWERFEVINRGSGLVALRSYANNKYVCADSYGNKPLIANRGAIGPWETFTLIRNTDGTVSLRAGANGRLVCADSYGNRPLIANRTVIGPWEKFDLVVK